MHVFWTFCLSLVASIHPVMTSMKIKLPLVLFDLFPMSTSHCFEILLPQTPPNPGRGGGRPCFLFFVTFPKSRFCIHASADLRRRARQVRGAEVCRRRRRFDKLRSSPAGGSEDNAVCLAGVMSVRCGGEVSRDMAVWLTR